MFLRAEVNISFREASSSPKFLTPGFTAVRYPLQQICTLLFCLFAKSWLLISFCLNFSCSGKNKTSASLSGPGSWVSTSSKSSCIGCCSDCCSGCCRSDCFRSDCHSGGCSGCCSSCCSGGCSGCCSGCGSSSLLLSSADFAPRCLGDCRFYELKMLNIN